MMDTKPGGASLTLQSVKVDRKVFSVVSFLEPSDERAYWLSKTPYERLQAAELMRQIVYGYDPSTTRLQRVLEIDHLNRNKKASGRHQDLADLEHLP
jgi:hypothetical protein